MTLLEYFSDNNIDCVDCYDTDYDLVIGIDFEPDYKNSEDSYERFMWLMYNELEVEHSTNKDSICVKFIEFVRNYSDKLKEFQAKYWKTSRYWKSSKSDFEYVWIKELMFYILGYTTDKVYDNFIKEVLCK